MRSSDNRLTRKLDLGTMDRALIVPVVLVTVTGLDPSRIRIDDTDGRGRPMRSGIHGTFATLLLMVPVLSIPALAIFGIPQFAPVVASPLDEGPEPNRERRVGQSARSRDDSFSEDFEDAPSFGSDSSDRRFETGHGRIGEAVSLSRSGRSANREVGRPNRSERFTQVAANDSAPSWHDEPSDEPAANLNDGPRSRGIDRSGLDMRDTRLDSRSSNMPELGQPRIQNASMPSGGTQMPRAFQRQRENLPERPSEITTVAGETEPLTWQSAVRKLNDLEIRNFRLQPGHRENQFVFICSYTPSDSPRVSYRFEAEADEPLKAVEKVLEQILEWQQRH